MPSRTLRVVDASTRGKTWDAGVQGFLRRDLAAGSRRIYAMTLAQIGAQLGEKRPLAEIGPQDLAAAVAAAYPDVAPATWNRVVATLRSFDAFCQRNGWTAGFTQTLERRRTPDDHTRSLELDVIERMCADKKLSTRDRALWRMLYETAARADEVLKLNVEDVDLAARRAFTVRKGGDRDVIHFATGTARLLPKLIDGRTRGPLFLADRAPAPSRAPALDDIDPTTGRARLSYRRAAEIFKDASSGATLHQMRHSALTHLAEAGVPTVLLMAKSRHASLRTLQRYARPSVEAVARLTAEHDSARRRKS